jgi:predicted DNA-binding transcriptional regulator AlpA
MLEPDEKLTPPEAARHLGLAPSTLAKMRCRGGSPTFLRLGRKIVYVRADLDEWLSGRRVRHTSEGDKLPRRLTDEPSARLAKIGRAL